MKCIQRAFLVFTATLATTFSNSAAQSLYETGREAWIERNYQKAHDDLLEFRRKPYGRRPAVDFMLGTSACRISDRRPWGHNVLDWMLYTYALAFESRQVVFRERDLCRNVVVAEQGTPSFELIKEERRRIDRIRQDLLLAN